MQAKRVNFPNLKKTKKKNEVFLFIISSINNFTYFFKRKYRQIRNVIRWMPIIWNQFDFDYRYAIDVFRFQLQKTADLLDSDNACTVDAKIRAQRIRTVIRLMDKVYDEEYACEYQQKLKDLYGEDVLEWRHIELPNGNYEIKNKYEMEEDADKVEEIDEIHHKLFLESREKQERAHALLWKLIEKDIRTWWD